MVDISSQNNKINVTVSSSGNTVNTNVTPDYAQYYSEKSREWAISNKIVDNTDYSSKYYANESKKQADISAAKATEVVESGNTAVSNIENARNNAIINVNTAGATQVALATEQATIATNKASEVIASGNNALSNIDTAKNNAITSIINQETTSKTSLIDEGATQIGLIQNEGATQIANVQSTGFYMRDDKLYYINSQGEETEFKLNDIELNNPYSLFDSKYSDHELNNLSWLKSEGQWNAKAVYTDAYDKILENVNNGVDGYKGVGYAYVYNDSTITVWITAPTPVVGATVYGWEPCHKIGTVESYTDSTITFFNKETNETATATRKADSNLPITSTYWITDYDFVLNTAEETFRLPLKTLHTDDTVDSLSLYFYVGETVQNANLIDAGRIGEQLAGKVDIDLTNANPSQAFKNKSVSWGIPDYSAGVSKSNTTYTAEVAGLVVCYASGNKNCTVHVNETLVGLVGGSATNVMYNFECFVAKGDVYKLTNWSNISFYPLKGAN